MAEHHCVQKKKLSDTKQLFGENLEAGWGTAEVSNSFLEQLLDNMMRWKEEE